MPFQRHSYVTPSSHDRQCVKKRTLGATELARKLDEVATA